MLRRILLTSVGAAALAGSALAADLPPPAPPPVYVPPVPVFTWAGPYVGGHVGYAWGNYNGNIFDVRGDFNSFNVGYDGFIGGGHIGWNWDVNQFGLSLNHWVIGIEGDVDGTAANRTTSRFVDATGFFPGFFPLVNASANIGVQASVRGRIGYGWDRWLLFGTGGVAFADFNTDISTPFGSAGRSSTRTGWTAGGGVEYAISDNWLVRSEYRYAQFGTTTLSATNAFAFPGAVAIGAQLNRKVYENRILLGLSYKFGPPPPPAPIVAKY
jgi:outer membrane immunogenic protein